MRSFLDKIDIEETYHEIYSAIAHAMMGTNAVVSNIDIATQNVIDFLKRLNDKL